MSYESEAGREELAPDQRPITTRQAAYLADVSGIATDRLVGRPIAELSTTLKWLIDPQLLFFRKVCGRVVKRDAVTGLLEGVPNATVHVEDTDCSFLGFFPVEGPWLRYWWFWLTSCNREEIATTRTDRCGNFCVWIPRWDIDRILHFRKQRHCFPEIYKPSLRDVLERYAIAVEHRKPPIPRDPNPPDPPFDVGLARQIGELVGHPAIERVAGLGATPVFGERIDGDEVELDAPAFGARLLAPLHGAALGRVEQVAMPQLDNADGALASLRDFDLSPRRAIGPFLRCEDVYVPEWLNIVDIPDITFSVTQDTDGDGVEEPIYSESYFDVRWNAGPIAPVTLEATPNALSSPICDGPIIPCGNTPAIVTVGLMPLDPTHHDNATGYATRVNRPSLTPGLYSEPWFASGRLAVPPGEAQAPYAGTLQLHGCQRIPGAVYYRLLYSHGSVVDAPLTGLRWWNPPTSPAGFATYGPTVTAAAGDADGDGWYPILPDSALELPNLLVSWETWNGFANGEYTLKVQVADASKTAIADPAHVSAPIKLVVDNSAPTAVIDSISWHVVGSPDPPVTLTWPFTCIVVERPKLADVEFQVSWAASAAHLRNAYVWPEGCGGGSPYLKDRPSPPPPALTAADLAVLDTVEHWHTDAADNSVTRTTTYVLPGSALQGAYAFWLHAISRAFNPAGDGGGPGTDWLTDYTYIDAMPHVPIAVIDS